MTQSPDAREGASGTNRYCGSVVALELVQEDLFAEASPRRGFMLARRARRRPADIGKRGFMDARAVGATPAGAAFAAAALAAAVFGSKGRR
jgi:hypothetical protein